MFRSFQPQYNHGGKNILNSREIIMYKNPNLYVCIASTMIVMGRQLLPQEGHRIRCRKLGPELVKGHSSVGAEQV